MIYWDIIQLPFELNGIDAKGLISFTVHILKVHMSISYDEGNHRTGHISQGFEVDVVVAEARPHQGAFTLVGFNLEISLARLSRLLQQRQAEADFAGSAGGKKWIYHLFHEMGGDSIPIILNLQDHLVIIYVLSNPYRHMRRVRRDGVLHDVKYVQGKILHEEL